MAAIATATESELLLYRVLQRANLTQYFETFIQQGGDDIAQLCEAGEEEFLEIMALVGMASKPLHVRRLQKALQEWVTNPGLFTKPIGPSTPHPPIASGSIIASVSCPQRNVSPCTANHNQGQVIPSLVEEATTPQTWIPKPESIWTPKPDSRSCSPNPITYSSSGIKSSISVQPISMATQSNLLLSEVMASESLPVFLPDPAPMWKAPISGGVNGASMSSSLVDQNSRSSLSPTPSTGSDTNPNGVTTLTSTSQIPMLSEQQLSAIECAAEALANELPEYEVRKLNLKKDVNREIMEVINMDEDNPEKMILLRKYSAIYGRFDSKRKNEGKMSLHEVSVNEASAQLCKRIPALLTRRDDLYPLSRRIVRDSGYQYSKGHSRATTSMDIPPNKKLKMECTKKSMSPSAITTTVTSYVPAQYENRVSEINKEINTIISQQEVLKSEIAKARETDDQSLLESLRNDLEKCQGRQLQLRMEQSGIVGSSRTKNPKCKSSGRSPLHVAIPANITPSQSPQHHSKPSLNQSDSAIDLSSSSSFHSDPASIATTTTGNSSSHGNHKGGSVEGNIMSSNDFVLDLSAVECIKKEGGEETKNKSLLDEGLRIAQQYGMCDLAEEIIYMKKDEEDISSDLKDKTKATAEVKRSSKVKLAGQGAEDSGNNNSGGEEINEQEEWNKEVERDMVKLKTKEAPVVTAKRGVRTRSSTAENRN